MRILFSCIFLLVLTTAAHAAQPLIADRISAPEPLLPYSTWLPDPEGKQTIDSIISGSVQQRFAPLPGGRFPLKAEGPVWLRLMITPPGGPAAGASRLSLNLGALPPGQTYLFMSRPPGQLGGENGWHAERVFPHEILDMPDPGLLPVTVYIRMDETPGLWFAPSISARSAVQPDVLPSALLLPGLFIAAATACLLRAIAERVLWPLWAALFLLCALAQSLLPLPALAGGFRLEHLPALLAPGMSLILLPHIGRCIFRPSGLPPARDAVLYLCSFIGVAVALGPLLPGLAWLTRLFPLWPLLAVPLLPLCVAALAARQPGALAFSGACAMPLLGAGVALYALYSAPFMHPLAAQGSLWGLAVGGLGLALARVPAEKKTAAQAGTSDKAETPAPIGLALAESAVDAAKAQAAGNGLELGETSAFTRRSQYDDLPPLEVTRLEEEQPTQEDMPPMQPEDEAPLLLSADMKHEQSAPDDTGASLDSEPPLQEATLDSEDAAKQAPTVVMGVQEDAVSATREQVISLVDDGLSAFSEELREMEEEAVRQTSFATESGFLFSLHSLVREVHSVVAPLAKSRGLVFSWYISPLLPSLLEGDAPRLRGALSLLLQNAVLATRKGAVQLAVRKNPGSSVPGDLLFIIMDNGSAQRTEAGFFHAWEMAARTGGVFTIESSPLGGTQISFTVRFALPSAQTDEELLDVVVDSGSSSVIDTDDEDIVPVLSSVLTPTGGDWTALAAPGLPDETDREDWTMTPEQVLSEQGFLAPLPVPADEAAPVAAEPEAPAAEALAPTPIASPIPRVPETPDKADRPLPSVSGLRRIVVSEMTTSSRRLLAHYLADLPHEYVSAAANAEVPDILRTGPVSLIIFDGDTPEYDIICALRNVRDEEREKSLPPVFVLVLANHEAQSERLLGNGANRVLVKPVSKDELYAIATQTPPVEGASHAPKAPPPPLDTVSTVDKVDTTGTAKARNTQEVDILAAALRDAPQQQGVPQEVSLPPRHGIATALDGLVLELDASPPGDAAAAPMLHGLSSEDVTPASDTPAPDRGRAAPHPAGSLLDFVLAPEQKPEDRVEQQVSEVLQEPENAAKHLKPKQLPKQEPSPTPEPEPKDAAAAPADAPEPAPEHEPEPVAAPEPEPATEPEKSAEQEQDRKSASFFLLPGMNGEGLDILVLPLTPGLIIALQDIMREIQQGAEHGQSIFIQEAAGRLAGKAEVFGLVKLGKIAHCVERAAEAGDLEAVQTLLDDLGPMVSRYVQSLQECFNAFMYADR